MSVLFSSSYHLLAYIFIAFRHSNFVWYKLWNEFLLKEYCQTLVEKTSKRYSMVLGNGQTVKPRWLANGQTVHLIESPFIGCIFKALTCETFLIFSVENAYALYKGRRRPASALVLYDQDSSVLDAGKLIFHISVILLLILAEHTVFISSVSMLVHSREGDVF